MTALAWLALTAGATPPETGDTGAPVETTAGSTPDTTPVIDAPPGTTTGGSDASDLLATSLAGEKGGVGCATTPAGAAVGWLAVALVLVRRETR